MNIAPAARRFVASLPSAPEGPAAPPPPQSVDGYDGRRDQPKRSRQPTLDAAFNHETRRWPAHTPRAIVGSIFDALPRDLEGWLGPVSIETEVALRDSAALDAIFESPAWDRMVRNTSRDTIEWLVRTEAQSRAPSDSLDITNRLMAWLDQRASTRAAWRVGDAAAGALRRGADAYRDLAREPELLTAILEQLPSDARDDAMQNLGLSSVESARDALLDRATRLERAAREAKSEAGLHGRAWMADAGVVAGLLLASEKAAPDSYLAHVTELAVAEGTRHRETVELGWLAASFVGVAVASAVSLGTGSGPAAFAAGAFNTSVTSAAGLGAHDASVERALLNESAGLAPLGSRERAEHERTHARVIFAASLVLPTIAGSAAPGLHQQWQELLSAAVAAGLALSPAGEPPEFFGLSGEQRARYSLRLVDAVQQHDLPVEVQTALLAGFAASRLQGSMSPEDAAAALHVYIADMLGK